MAVERPFSRMGPHMSRQSRILGKGHRADAALVGTRASVDSFVDRETGVACEALGARVALVRTFSSVCPDVDQQGVLPGESHWTKVAVVGTFSGVDSHVLRQTCLAGEPFGALVALKLTFVCVRFQVIHEFVLALKILVAHGTPVRMFYSVVPAVFDETSSSRERFWTLLANEENLFDSSYFFGFGIVLQTCKKVKEGSIIRFTLMAGLYDH